MPRVGARWWFERLHGLAPEELGVDRGGSVGRTMLWKCYHKRHHDGPVPAVTGEEEENALWPQRLRSSHHWRVVLRRSAGLRAPLVAARPCWRCRRGSGWWLSTRRASPQQEGSRGATTRAKASAGVGGGDTCMDRDALRLLTMLEGSPSQPRGYTSFSPAPRRACWSSTSRE